MARKLRVEFPGAVYHVLNRGNYRRDLFVSAGEAQAFVRTLEEGAAAFGWRVYAYAVMRNHYHLAIQTPQPNLKLGMHWLQSTFATRFNRLHRERGHLFQGRYTSLLVGDDTHLARLVDYIHLNPVRAGIVGAEQTDAFRWSSLGRFVRGARFAEMETQPWLQTLDCDDDADGWSRYLRHLRGLARDAGEQKRCGFENMSQGWAIGTDGWRKAVAQDHNHLALNPGLAADVARTLQTSRWAEALERCLADDQRAIEEAKEDMKCAPWKLAIAARLRSETGASVTWIAEHLSMGKASTLRSKLTHWRKKQQNSA